MAGVTGHDSYSETEAESVQRTSTETAQQLRELHSQLLQVEEFIRSDPTNEQYLQTRDDLFNVISMTEDLIEVQNNDQLQLSSATLTSAGASGSNPHWASENFQIGDHLEVLSGERPYPAVLLSVNLPLSQCTLKYYEYGTEVTLSLSEVRVITGKGELKAEEVAPGLRCQCKYPPDQKWYDAKIEAVTPEAGVGGNGCSYTVVFTQYGSTLELPLEYLRRMRLSSSKLTKRLSERHMEPAVVIPDNLKINPTDTEAVSCPLSLCLLTPSSVSFSLSLSLCEQQKEKKKRKVKAIKSKARLEVKEQAQSATQDNWRAFQTKVPPPSLSLSPPQAEKKSLKLATAPSTKKQSLFSSPEAVDGRVGVTGSGQGMTDYEHRKRYKFNLANT
jgi:hypothetical protein